MTSGEETGDRLSRIEERLDRIETLVQGLGDGRWGSDRGGNREPLDVEQAQERVDELGERIEETRRNTLGQDTGTEEVSETEDPAPEADTEQAEEAVGEGPPGPG
jgi:tetrahydromethanopterin S-methyltransferase subunit G